jgi:very-short-patch-repair endonuclease
LRKVAKLLLLAAALLGGYVWGQDAAPDGKEGGGGDLADTSLQDLAERLTKVRREIKIIDLDESLGLVPGLVARENEYAALLAQMRDAKDVQPLLVKARELKLAQLEDANRILKLHRGKHTGLTEEQVWERLTDARFQGIHFREEWLVNILDFLEDEVGINVELDARVYKFDTVTFDFDKTSARAMLQMMGDILLFKFVVRGDTLYVFKERNEVLFGGEWIQKKKAAWKARKDALEEARKEAEKKALEENK